MNSSVLNGCFVLMGLCVSCIISYHYVHVSYLSVIIDMSLHFLTLDPYTFIVLTSNVN